MPTSDVQIYREQRNVSPMTCKELLRFENYSIDLSHHFILYHTESGGGALSRRQKMEVFLC